MTTKDPRNTLLRQWKTTHLNPEVYEPGDWKAHSGGARLIEVEWTQMWRVLDGDNTWYARGVAAADVDFQPLDDYYGPDSGCTTIEYMNPKTRQWTTL